MFAKLPTTLIAIVLASFSSGSFAQILENEAPAVPKNIVIMIGDGMGPAYTSAYRYYRDNHDTEEIEQTVFDRLLVGSASTYPARESGYVTDSAAAATALATGVKTYNGAISVDSEKQPIPTLMQQAKKAGMAIGVAVSSQVNHATPAAFLVHNESRRNYEAIAKDYLDTDADVILGGGQRYFSQALIEQFEQRGYQYLSDMQQLDQIQPGKVLGLFADVQLPWAIDEPNSNHLSRLTQVALDQLSQHPQGFVLLVEGSLIDWAGHNNDIATAMMEMHEFANAIEVVEQYVRQHSDTLMVVTADHSTGGLTIAANGTYEWHPKYLKNISATPRKLANASLADPQWQTSLVQQLGFDIDTDELRLLDQARMQGEAVLATAIKQLIDKRTNTGWTTGGHTGIDVPVFANGPAAKLFSGQQDNTDIANKIFSLLPRPGKAATKPKQPAAEVSATDKIMRAFHQDESLTTESATDTVEAKTQSPASDAAEIEPETTSQTTEEPSSLTTEKPSSQTESQPSSLTTEEPSSDKAIETEAESKAQTPQPTSDENPGTQPNVDTDNPAKAQQSADTVQATQAASPSSPELNQSATQPATH